jgi:spore germination protein KA
MFNKLIRKYHYLKLKAINETSKKEEKERIKIPKSVNDIQNKLNDIFADSTDFVMRKVDFGKEKPIKILIVFLDGLIKKETINDSVVRPILNSKHSNKDINIKETVKLLKEKIITSIDIEATDDFDKTLDGILSGETVVYIDGSEKAFRVGAQEFKGRSIGEPQTEVVIRGPREAFVENARINLTLIRRKIKNPKLKIEMFKLGVQTKTDIYICYIKDVVHEDIIKTLKKRLNSINTDSVLDSGYIEEFIEDAPLSIFPTVASSEKPDVISSKILEGRVAVICDGSPFVMTVPYLFAESFQFSEDYYKRWCFGSFARIFTLIGFGIAFLSSRKYRF